MNGPAVGISATTLALYDVVYAVNTAYFRFDCKSATSYNGYSLQWLKNILPAHNLIPLAIWLICYFFQCFDNEQARIVSSFEKKELLQGGIELQVDRQLSLPPGH